MGFKGSSIKIRYSIFVILFFSVAGAWGQSATNQPRIGYLYPAGAQQGTVIRVTAGGQSLRNSTEVYVSGDGVSAKVIKYIRPFRNLQSEQRKWLQTRLKELRDEQLAKLTPTARRSAALSKRPSSRRSTARKTASKRTPAKSALKKKHGKENCVEEDPGKERPCEEDPARSEKG